MYEELTAFLPKLSTNNFGEWIVDTENDGSSEHPIQLPFVNYNATVYDFIHAVYHFVDIHEDLELRAYSDILQKANIDWGAESMEQADVSTLNGQVVMALILGVIRADRFYEGTLMDFLENGKITEWLSRLKEIDATAKY